MFAFIVKVFYSAFEHIWIRVNSHLLKPLCTALLYYNSPIGLGNRIARISIFVFLSPDEVGGI